MRGGADARGALLVSLQSLSRDSWRAAAVRCLAARMALARQLIARGATLADAAASAGFADQSHMTRAFVRLLGVTPANYAAAMR